MKIDIFTKILLTIIAIALSTIAANQLINPAIAYSSIQCKGELTVSSFGADTPISGGYNVDVTCN